ncbi:MAG: homoserine dehydrogenase [Sphaerochaetaceae bacterium]|nr:homoserine dehydrogenase [Sphaerochaetaceae bacterium]
MIVSILGHGVVGKGVYDMLQACPEYTVRTVLVKPGEADPEKKWMVESIDYVLNDDSELVIECMGGVEPAFQFTSKCLEAGKGLISSNKALVAARGIELMNLARSKNLPFLFSAACGGAIPILHNLHLARQTDQILWAGGILNGTTNYMLDAMDRRGLSFDAALAEAKQLGYAEADPTADITGLDTLRKVMLISMVAYDTIPSSDYNIEGIQNVSAADFAMAKQLGCTIRLVGKAGLSESGRLYAYVEPVVCSKTSSYAGVCSNTNLAYYQGKNAGFMTFGGQGAGRYPTASAILRDVTSVSYGQKQVLTDKCMIGFAFNGSKECENTYIVRVDSASLAVAQANLPICKTLAEKDGLVYAVTEKISVKAMHDAASEIRRKNAQMFFAEYNEENA